MATESTATSERAPDDPDRQRWRRILRIAAIVVGVLVVLVAIGLGALYWWAEQRVDREDIGAIEERDDERTIDAPVLNFLVLGSDSREGMTHEERQRLELGQFEDERADTILLVQIHQEREQAAVVSIPRDLRIVTADGPMKINGALEQGPNAMVRAVEALVELDIDHYVEVSVPGFLTVVEAIGTVEICLDEPLRDEKSGADFDAGCHQMTSEDALAFIRSREGERGDFQRIERQHAFVEAVMDELTSARNLLNPNRLVRIVERASRHLTTDEALGLGEMRALAAEIREVVEGDLLTTTVPAYAQEIDGVPYVLPYQPGLEELFSSLRRGQLPDSRGTGEGRGEVEVVMYTGGNLRGATRVRSTLFFSGFAVENLGPGPHTDLRRTAVHPLGPDEAPAEWIAAILGVEVSPLPDDLAEPAGGDVLVVVGEDASFDPAVEVPSIGGAQVEPDAPTPTADGSPTPTGDGSPTPTGDVTPAG